MNSRVLLYAFVFLPGLIFAGGPFIDKKILDVDEAFIFKSSIVENKILISWKIKPGHYLYKKSILIQAGDKILKHNYRSKNELKISDEFFGESIIFKDNLEVDAEFSNVNPNILDDIKVTYQGCAEGRYCYPEIIKSI
jgi:thiol:disulfide interchange protein DsbD